jgi:hypothetical protein
MIVVCRMSLLFWRHFPTIQIQYSESDEFDVVCNFDLKGDGLVWYARPQLFFNVTLCRWDCQDKEYSADHKEPEVSLVYFSTFEPINPSLTPNSVIQRAKVPMLYYTASNPRLPCLYICLEANVLGQAALIPCFIDGDTHPTIPYKFKDNRLLGTASADTQKDRGNGSRLYEVNLWLWRYRRSQPRTMSIEEAEAVRRERVSETRSRARAEETKKRRKKAAAGEPTEE